MVDQWIWYVVRYLVGAGTVGLFGIGMGPSSGEKTQAGETGALANFATAEGESDIMSADKFWQAIMSGDPGQISKVLGPQLSGINKRGQQQKKTMAEFGTRSGGTAAAANSIDDTTRSSVDALISNLTSGAASSLGSSGSSLLGTGLAAHDAAFGQQKTIHDERSAQLNDIFKSTAAFAAAPFTGGGSLGMGTFSKPGGGGGDSSSNWWDNVNFPGDDTSGQGDDTSGQLSV